MWASTLCPFSSSTRNMALGRGSTTVPSTSIASSLATLQLILCVGTRPEGARNVPREGRKSVYGQVSRCVHALQAPVYGSHRDATAASVPGGQYLVPVVGYRDGVLEMRREGPVGGDDGPSVGHDRGLVLAQVQHGLDRDDQAGAKLGPPAGLAPVLDERVLVEGPAD